MSGHTEKIYADGKPMKQSKRKLCDTDDVQETNTSPSTDHKKRIRIRPASALAEGRPSKKFAVRVVKVGSSCSPQWLKTEKMKEKRSHTGNYVPQKSFITSHQRMNALTQVASLHTVEESSRVEALFEAKETFDRYLAKTDAITEKGLLTLALTSFYLACKNDQNPIPLNYHLKSFGVSLTDCLEMEKKVSKVLDREYSVPNPLNFLKAYAKVSQDSRHQFLSEYILELSHRETNMLNHYPSQIAAAAMLVANKMLLKEAWSSEFEDFTGYKEEDLSGPVNVIISTLRNEKKKKSGESDLPLSPTTKKRSFVDVVDFALCPAIQENSLSWSPILPVVRACFSLS